jgi:hypothetical protein
MQKHSERTDKRPPINKNGNNNNNTNNSGSNNNNNNNNNTNLTGNNNNNNASLSTNPTAAQEQSYWSNPKISPDSIATEIVQHHEFQLNNDNDIHHQRDENDHINGHSSNLYDTQSKLTANSAFTPINAIQSHINVQHHQLSQRPIYYDTISIQNKNMPQNTGNSFPNQLISLHQIRNYSHQPNSLMSNEHLVISNAIGKDKA